MIAPQALNPAFQQFPLDGRRPFIVALLDKKVSQGSNRAQPQIVVCPEMASQIPNRSFQQRTRLRFSGLPIRDRNLGHQTKGLRMIRSEPALVGAQGREHGRELGSFNRYTSGGLHSQT
jgi:hypothetical protein